MLDDIVQTLGPIHEVTLKLQEEDLTASEFYFAWYSSRKKIEKQSGRFSNILLKCLKTRGQSILYEEPILAGVYLDPRYQILLTSDQKEVAKVHLKRLLKRKYDYENVSLDSSSPRTCSFSSSVSADDVEMLLKQLDNNKDSFSLPPSINVVEAFDNVKRLPHNSNIFEFWENQSIKELKDIAQIVLAIPATQVSVERAFSILKFILSDQRAEVDKNLLDDILLIKMY